MFHGDCTKGSHQLRTVKLLECWSKLIFIFIFIMSAVETEKQSQQRQLRKVKGWWGGGAAVSVSSINWDCLSPSDKQKAAHFLNSGFVTVSPCANSHRWGGRGDGGMGHI